MFKKRSKAKQSASGPPVHRPILSPEDEHSANGPEEPQESGRHKLSIEEVRSKYGLMSIPSLPTQGHAIQSTFVDTRGIEVDCPYSADAGDGTVRKPRTVIEEAMDLDFDRDWEAEQLRKVGVTAPKYVIRENTLQEVVVRLEKRLKDLDDRAEELQNHVEELESSL